MEKLLLILCLGIAIVSGNPNCTTQSPCGCDLNGGGSIDLSGYRRDSGKSYIESAEANGIIYRFFPCGAGQKWGASDSDCKIGDALCVYKVNENVFYSVGRASAYSIIEAVADTENVRNSYLKIEYHAGSLVYGLGELFQSTIAIRCGEEGTPDVLKFINEFPIPVYNFELTSSKACPQGRTTGTSQTIVTDIVPQTSITLPVSGKEIIGGIIGLTIVIVIILVIIFSIVLVFNRRKGRGVNQLYM